MKIIQIQDNFSVILLVCSNLLLFPKMSLNESRTTKSKTKTLFYHRNKRCKISMNFIMLNNLKVNVNLSLIIPKTQRLMKNRILM